MFSQDLATCDPKGRDCIERNSSETFHCNTTCAGINADVEWVKKDIEVDITEEISEETMKADLERSLDGDLKRIYHLLKTDMKFMKNDIGEMMKIATGKRGEELDKDKYKMLVSDYRKFKTTNVKHFRFNSAANLSTFGKP